MVTDEELVSRRPQFVVPDLAEPPRRLWAGRESLLAALELGERLERHLQEIAATQGGGASLRKVLRQLGQPVSTAWRARAIYKLVLEHPEIAQFTHLGVGHLAELLAVPKEIRVTLLHRAETEGWSRRKLARAVVELNCPEKPRECA